MTKSQGWMVARFIIIILFFFAAVWTVTWIFKVSYPFWIAFALVWIFIPFIKWMRERLKFPNGIAVLITLLIGLSTIVAFFTGITFLIIFGVRRISNNVPVWIEQASVQIQTLFNQQILPQWQKVTGFVDDLSPEQQGTLQEGITQLGSQLASIIAEMGHKIADGLTHLIMAVPTFLIAFLFIFIAFYFIGKDWDNIWKHTINALPAVVIKKGREFRKMFRKRVFGFLRAQIILMGVASIIVLIGLLILQIEQAYTIAIIVGVAEILPYLGSGTILIPWFIYLFITGNIKLGIGIAIVYGVTVFIRQSIEPKILSTSMNLNTLAVLMALFIGFQIFGVVGVFIGPFLLVIFVILKDIGVIASFWTFIRLGWKNP
ncbi:MULTISPECIES: sporulation integral membrane protein YtvI [Bacillaceae]|uniref:Sporulation integral membrane protein YtvI n=1 Tax=Evansella alkalicola TaxID=745819 RepID=A0ABS6JQJ9_9BACI|nr:MULTISPECIES: sporulation integral membrane protein YtvI [Bacillaceae]MBU9719999.1 sporulation integral membrane protein YtvI [Bacillus alkalicola]